MPTKKDMLTKKEVEDRWIGKKLYELDGPYIPTVAKVVPCSLKDRPSFVLLGNVVKGWIVCGAIDAESESELLGGRWHPSNSIASAAEVAAGIMDGGRCNKPRSYSIPPIEGNIERALHKLESDLCRVPNFMTYSKQDNVAAELTLAYSNMESLFKSVRFRLGGYDSLGIITNAAGYLYAHGDESMREQLEMMAYTRSPYIYWWLLLILGSHTIDLISRDELQLRSRATDGMKDPKYRWENRNPNALPEDLIVTPEMALTLPPERLGEIMRTQDAWYAAHPDVPRGGVAPIAQPSQGRGGR